jgi:hypothetical protein
MFREILPRAVWHTIIGRRYADSVLRFTYSKLVMELIELGI